MNYDTVLPERILRRYRRPLLRVPHWIKQGLAIGAFTLSGLVLICLLASINWTPALGVLGVAAALFCWHTK